MEVSIGIITSAILTILAAWITWQAITAWLSWRRLIGHLKKIPQDKPHWLFGSLNQFPGPGEEGLAYMREKAHEYPRIGCIWYGPFHPSVALGHPETIKSILKTSEPKPFSYGAYRFMKPWLGDGLLLSRDRKWARNRRLLTPAFHFDILRPYVTVSNEATDVFIEKLAGFAERKETFNAGDHVSHVTLDTLLRCAFSYDNDVQFRGSEHPYVKAVSELTRDLTNRLLSPWLYNNFIYFYLSAAGRRFQRNCEYVHGVSSEIIKTRRETLNKTGDVAPTRRYLDFLDVLLTARDDQGQGLTDQEIRDEADTFLFEGHDTTASGIMWTLYSLAGQPECQRRCQQEVDAILDGRDSDHILWEDLSRLPYLTMCIKEAMRIHVPVPFLQRELTEDVTIDGYFIPKGVTVDMHIYSVHHNPTVWQDSMKYDPERFSADNMAKKDSHAFVPFSAGPRNCIGQHFAMHELKVVVGRILRRFDLRVAAGHTARHVLGPVMRSENGVYLTVTPRDANP